MRPCSHRVATAQLNPPSLATPREGRGAASPLSTSPCERTAGYEGAEMRVEDFCRVEDRLSRLRSDAKTALRAICAVLLLLVIYSRSASSEVPEGIWLLANRVAIQVFDCSGLLCGKIVWLVRPRTPAGQPDVDHRNPDPKSQERPLCGLIILWGCGPTVRTIGPMAGFTIPKTAILTMLPLSYRSRQDIRARLSWRSAVWPHRNTNSRSAAQLRRALLRIRSQLSNGPRNAMQIREGLQLRDRRRRAWLRLMH